MKIGLVSLGCAKNQVDSEQMLYLLHQAGHTFVPDPAEAEVIIINTCAFIDDAKQESIDAILEAIEQKTKGSCARVLVTGCLAQRYGQALLQEMPEVDGILGVEQYADFMPFFEKSVAGERILNTDRTGKTLECGRILTTPSFSAYVRIAEGCDHRCTYCAIPLIRGNYRSRNEEDILNEMRLLAQNGASEQIFIAQDTTGYGRDLNDGRHLVSLLAKANDIPDIHWLRVLYLYAADVTCKLIDDFCSVPKLCRYLDVPLQHASPAVLRRMGRKGDIAQIKEALLHARKKGFALRTTMIVGFPGETEKEFEELLSFVREVRFDRLGAFAYSIEEDTPAEKLSDQLPEKIKKERLDALMRLQADISLKRNEARIGKSCEVLLTEKKNGLWICRSPWEAPDADGLIYARGEGKVGEYRSVVPDQADVYDLYGKLA